MNLIQTPEKCKDEKVSPEKNIDEFPIYSKERNNLIKNGSYKRKEKTDRISINNQVEKSKLLNFQAVEEKKNERNLTNSDQNDYLKIDLNRYIYKKVI